MCCCIRDPSNGGQVVELDLTAAPNKEGGLTSSEAENEEGVAVGLTLSTGKPPTDTMGQPQSPWLSAFGDLTLTPNLGSNLSARAGALSAG